MEKATLPAIQLRVASGRGREVWKELGRSALAPRREAAYAPAPHGVACAIPIVSSWFASSVKARLVYAALRSCSSCAI